MPDSEPSLQDRYIRDHDFFESRFGVPPLADLITDSSAIGASRFTILPSFSPESVYTLVYTENEVRVTATEGTTSLWESLYGAPWHNPTERQWIVSIARLPPPLDSWAALKSSALDAPTVMTEMLDGISFGHRICDHTDDFCARWHNPARKHVEQLRLIKAYSDLLKFKNRIP